MYLYFTIKLIEHGHSKLSLKKLTRHTQVDGYANGIQDYTTIIIVQVDFDTEWLGTMQTKSRLLEIGTKFRQRDSYYMRKSYF